MLIYLAPNNHSLRVPWKINPFKGTEHEMKPKNVLQVGKSSQRLGVLQGAGSVTAHPLPRIRAAALLHLRFCSTCAFPYLLCSHNLTVTILPRCQLCDAETSATLVSDRCRLQMSLE